MATGLAPTWSPDGRFIAFADRAVAPRIVLINLRTGSRRVLGSTEYEGSRPEWSPDGRRIAFVASRGYNVDVLVATVATRVVRRIRFNAFDPREEFVDASLAWSPDGRWIALVMSAEFDSRDAGGFNDLFVVRPDGAILRRVTRGRSSPSCPTWSPNSRRIAFGNAAGTGAGTIAVVALNGTGLRRMVTGFAPEWSPDGKTIAFTVGLGNELTCDADPPPPPRVGVINADGRGVHRVFAGSRPRWSRSSRELLVETSRGLYVVRRDGRGARRITTNPRDELADWR